MRKNRLSITWAPFYASLAVISALGLFIGIFWTINEYQAYKESIDNIINNYNNQYQSRVREEVNSATDYIHYSLQEELAQAEEDIRKRGQVAYTVASHIYSLYKNEKDIAELRKMVTEILRPIRWNDGQGYYFAGRIDTGTMDLFADEPILEGKGSKEIISLTGVDIMGMAQEIIQKKGAGLFSYDLLKPNYPGRIYFKRAFVKYFPPFDWFIGAGVYRNDSSYLVQDDAIKQLQNMTFGDGGEIFIFRFNGTIICSRDEKLLGRSITSLKDSKQHLYGEELWRAGVEGAQEGFVTYSGYRKGGDLPRQKLSYVRAYPELGWVIGASSYMEEMEQAIAAETETYQRISFRNVFMFIVLFVVAVILLLFSTYFYSLKIQRGVQSFTNFFRGAADSNEKVEQNELEFIEFEDLAKLANQMVDERIQNEKLLHKDELRLDTLLGLSMMDTSIQDKYDFILERIVQITDSDQGYIALVNENQSYTTLCAYVAAKRQRPQLNNEIHLSAPIAEGGLMARAVLKRDAILDNNCRLIGARDVYPYHAIPHRHLDVPVYNNGKIVMVAGVCNSSSKYNQSDIRQIKMLLEGMWMHVLKKCAEEENSRLEKQIISVSEEERSAIGRDLHDDLCSHLTGVELLSKVLHQKLEKEDSSQIKQIGTIRDLIRDAIDKTRRLSHGLYPVHIVEYGLKSAIEELVVEVKNMFRVNCLLEFQGNTEEVNSETVIHLHYAIREAVFNAARHGHPQNIYIDVRFDENFFIQVRDDGCGFQEGHYRKGLGFYTMEYRAKMMGAQLNINSEPNNGTTVTISGMVD
ncbi:cache domain-containing protein [Desulfotalea psychrophila]|uniref:histidine kinase n=1 Tax=Desulfotalea psychrophila (strain LSv54 / DSM 12343) TaxID=177439 RepID=Q6AMC2_DESPS|nr:cache domain-containing protein [Desulfotalea psychrophila]CAG36503.1 related to two-component system sensor histidine kinase (Nar family) [Desulfotalea psychrophila LSv54]